MHAINPDNIVNLKIDGINVAVAEGTTILEAAHKAGIKIPTLCHHPDLGVRASCRICLVEVKGQKKYKTACNTLVEEGNEIYTNTKTIRETRKTVLELLIADHPMECLKCVRNLNCELQDLAREFSIYEIPFPQTQDKRVPLVSGNSSIVLDMNKCVKCGRCIEACNEIQSVGAINTGQRSDEYQISTAFEQDLADSPCVSCGQCTAVCPVGALTEKDDTYKVWQALDNPDLHVVVQVAPAVRVAFGDEFGMECGTVSTDQIVAALRRLGFAKVFDTGFTADLTIWEESSELLERLQNGGVLPMFTSCSPGWINFIEKIYPEFIPNLSTCKSPQQMFGALAKTYYAEKEGIPPEKIFVVSVMPCTAKKYESERPEMNDSGFRDVDVVLTTRELARMVRQAGINISALSAEEFDHPLGISTGAAVIFGATGGVMEAALRNVYESVTGGKLDNVNFQAVRGLKGFKEAEVDLNGIKIKVAVVNGLKNARILLEKIKRGECGYHFIEIMACPGGCVGGGGQPYRTTMQIKKCRLESIYEIDRNMTIRKPQQNTAVAQLYRNFLGGPLGHKSHELLHTRYVSKKQ